MAQYTLQIFNQSGTPQDYVFFMQLPQVTSSSGQPQIFTNAWVTFPGVLSGGFDMVNYTDVTYAFWGTTPSQLAPNVIIDSGGFAPVDTTTQDSVPFVAGPPTGFGNVSHGGATPGSYRIIAGTDFTPAYGFVFGLASATGTPLPSPVATFAAEPNQTYNITPVVKFYVAAGSYMPGQLIDVQSFSTTPAEINFTGTPFTTATVTQGTNGAFSVAYTDTSPTESAQGRALPTGEYNFPASSLRRYSLEDANDKVPGAADSVQNQKTTKKAPGGNDAAGMRDGG